MPNSIEIKIPIQSTNSTVVDLIHSETELSKQAIKSAMEKGCVWHQHGKKTKRVRRAKKIPNTGDIIHLYYNETILSSIPKSAELLMDKDSYSIWFKPGGVFSQGSKWGDHCAMTRLVEKSLNRPVFLVHRLDRATSGLMMFAHNKKMARQLSELFADRVIKKTYLAIVSGKHPKRNSVHQLIDGKTAISHFSLIDEKNQQSLLSVEIETGRKHQIRKHLSSAGYPILGDRLYGDAGLNTQDLALQAIRLEFVCPITKQLIDVEIKDEKRIKL